MCIQCCHHLHTGWVSSSRCPPVARDPPGKLYWFTRLPEESSLPRLRSPPTPTVTTQFSVLHRTYTTPLRLTLYQPSYTCGTHRLPWIHRYGWVDRRTIAWLATGLDVWVSDWVNDNNHRWQLRLGSCLPALQPFIQAPPAQPSAAVTAPTGDLTYIADPDLTHLHNEWDTLIGLRGRVSTFSVNDTMLDVLFPTSHVLLAGPKEPPCIQKALNLGTAVKPQGQTFQSHTARGSNNYHTSAKADSLVHLPYASEVS